MSENGKPNRDSTVLRILVALGLAETGLLYVLIAVETPLSPIVHALMRNPPGVFTLVMLVVAFLWYGVVLVLALRQRYGARPQRVPPPANRPSDHG
jgi:hypothetical protein